MKDKYCRCGVCMCSNCKFVDEDCGNWCNDEMGCNKYGVYTIKCARFEPDVLN